MMKKLIVRMSAFIVFGVFIYLLCICVLGISKITVKNMNFFYCTPDRLLLRIEEIKQFDSLDIVFLGSSRSFMGFDPRIFSTYGYSSYNFSSLAQTPLQTRYLYDKYVKDIDVDLVVFEVNPDVFRTEGTEATISLINNDYIDYEMLKLVWKIKQPMVYNTFVFRCLQSILGHKLLFTADIGSFVKGTGYVPSMGTNMNYLNLFKPDTIHCNSEQITEFKKLLNTLNTQHRKYILVQAPVSKNYYKSLIGTDEFDKLMNSFGEYYNFNNLITMDDSLDFNDHHHLNSTGVQKFNNALIRIIKR